LRRQGGAKRAFTGDFQTQSRMLGVHPRKGRDQHVEAFFGSKTTRRKNQRCPIRHRERRTRQQLRRITEHRVAARNALEEIVADACRGRNDPGSSTINQPPQRLPNRAHRMPPWHQMLGRNNPNAGPHHRQQHGHIELVQKTDDQVRCGDSQCPA
jgi:hypothetical protein